MDNPNSQLDPQDDTSALAHMTPQEMAEYNEWLDYVASKGDACQQ